ncbi:MAG: response regulator [Sulfurimonas sp.]|uniref:response regulator n=1 Tax=Sulfurimonas sp. TaxID=2022749 RepID=UPI0026276760|nr:response regulator [Sulfurimonas sp.]MDD2652928.1 response regulator [Sulfurimonas sp.]MDD3452374.1 response regulator [Sulfurimonas sp.]
MKVLVVDDSKIARISVIKNVVGVMPDVEVFEATNGLEAVELFAKERPSAVFLDLTMPVMNGYEALKRIMEIDKAAQVIIVSADIQSEAKLRVLAAGAKNMYPKPINHEIVKLVFEKDLLV